MLEYPLILVFPAVMAFAGAMDLLTMTIPNRITLGLALAFLPAAIVMGLAPSEILMHVATGALVLVIGIALFAVGGFGGGDAKLLAAGALWIGMDGLLSYLLLVTLFGGLLSLVVVLYRRYPATALPLPNWAARLHAGQSGIPYGIAIACAALTIFPVIPWVVAAAG